MATVTRSTHDQRSHKWHEQSITIFLAVIAAGFLILTCGSLSLPSQRHQRRNFFKKVMLTNVLVGEAIVNVAHAACLPGDLDPSCIGVYKLPVDDKMLPFVETEEALKKFAPDINYVPPVTSTVSKSVDESLANLWAQRRAADDIKVVITAGRLQEAGIKVLNLIPRVVANGRNVMQEVATLRQQESATIQSLRMQQLQEKYDILVADFNSLDVMIGQGIRGQMGVAAVAQINILEELKEAVIAFDDFLFTIQKELP